MIPIAPELLEKMGDWGPPVQVMVRREGSEYTLIARTVHADPYVHDLLDAFLSGNSLDFGHHAVPQDVQDRLAEAVRSGQLGTAPKEEE
jgi:hypothetical protein